MISYKLMFVCLVLCGTYLILFSLLYEWIGRWLRIARGVPETMLETTGVGWFVVNYLMELLFYAAIPVLAYGFFYVVLPLDGLRAALACVLLAFILGATPIVMGLSVRIKLSISFLLYQLLGYLLKLAGSMVIIAIVYNL